MITIIKKKPIKINFIIINLFKYKKYNNNFNIENININNKSVRNFLTIFNSFYYIKISKLITINFLKISINKLNINFFSSIKHKITNFHDISLNFNLSRFKNLNFCYNYKFLFFFSKSFNTSFNSNCTIFNIFSKNIFKSSFFVQNLKNKFIILNKDQIFNLLNNNQHHISLDKIYPFKKYKNLVFFNKNYFHIKLKTNHYLNKKLTFYYNFTLNNKLVKNFYNYNVLIKKSVTSVKYFIKYLNVLNDFFLFDKINFSFNFVSNKYLINYLNFFDIQYSNLNINNENKNLINYNFIYNNYYPVIFLKKRSYDLFFKNLKANLNLNFLFLSNKIVLNFLEILLKKNIFLKITSNRFNKINNFYLDSLLQEYKNFQPLYFKNFLFSDFLIILWYSFMLKDLKLISQ